ncbi:hypothetical protein Hanom_Chr01g00055891 [Helianthus anomalus]
MVDAWERWFSRLYIREDIPPIFESGKDAVDSRLSQKRRQITGIWQRIVSLFWSIPGKRFSVEFKEIVGQWSPAFLDEANPLPESPGQSSEYGGPSFAGEVNSKGLGGNSSDACSGNSKGFSSPFHEEHEKESDVHGKKSQPHVAINEEREIFNHEDSVGPGFHNSNLGYESESPMEEFRPNLITVRPKRIYNPIVQEQGSPVPDLNLTVDKSLGSDPFNIEELFRREREVGGDRDQEAEMVETMGDRQVEERDRPDFDTEVAQTMDFGACLGIGIEGLEK